MKLLPEKLLIMEFMKRQLNKFHDKLKTWEVRE